MGVNMIYCEDCNESQHEDNFESCLICENKEMCNSCCNDTIEFKCGERFVCKDCICEPLSSPL